jgi:hypothetical protein
MKFSTPIIAIAALFASTEACQCLSADGINVASTFNCCREAGGRPGGDQCPAHQIRKKLSNFAKCCRTYGDRLDCRCPMGCNDELHSFFGRGRMPPTDSAVNDILTKYAE